MLLTITWYCSLLQQLAVVVVAVVVVVAEDMEVVVAEDMEVEDTAAVAAVADTEDTNHAHTTANFGCRYGVS